MKLHFLTYTTLFFITACSTTSLKTPDFQFEKKEETKKEVITEIPIKKEITNYDLEFQNSLKDVWGNYFKENYNDSRSLDIYVYTNRNMKGQIFGCTDQYFGINEDANHTLRLGVCRVNVPKNHSTGQIEFSDDRKSSSHHFFKIVQSKFLKEDNLFDFIKKTKRTPLIFVHGFNVPYQEAVLRAGQITYDLKYQGPVILFTWPSGSGEGFLDNKLLNKTYALNSQSAKASIEHFKDLILKLHDNNIPANIIVHSMGHQVVLWALKNVAEKIDNYVEQEKAVNELILNAPDFYVDDFQNILDGIKRITKRITLYCSYNDKAMAASTRLNKNLRLGACADFEGVDTVNVSLIDDKTFSTGHSYYSSREVISDVFQVLLGLDVEKRLFMKKSEPNAPEKFFLRN